MARRNLFVSIGMEPDLVNKSCSLARKAQSTPNRSYLFDNTSRYAIFAFRGSATIHEWYAGTGKPFGNTSVDLKLFRCLKSIGNDEVAGVNFKFFEQFRGLIKEDYRLSDPFEDLLKDPQLGKEVRQAVSQKKKVVFTGFSSGGPIAILATILFLQQNLGPASLSPLTCVTFGSPLVGNQIFGHALRRENWAQYFVHFVMKYDIIPRILLSPLSSIKGNLHTVLPSFNSNQLEPIAISQDASSSFYDIMRNASALASHTACNYMGCTNSLLQTISSFIELSPYRPFGTYVFCTGRGKMFTIKNPDAILQLLFYSLQLDNREAVTNIACRSFKDHLQYEFEISGNTGNEDVIDLEHLLLQLPLSSTGTNNAEMGSIQTVINELGLSTRAMLCLTAARESEEQKQRNQKKIDGNRDKIEKELEALQNYRIKCEGRRVGYYDAFKLQQAEEDFKANVTRLELAGIWDEIIEMLKRYELPDSFEGRKDWVDLGTKFRRLMEPLDIANYYRHSKDEDTGAYMRPDEGRQPRPKRYRFTQKWLEYADCKPAGFYLESCFWAEVEDLRIHTSDQNNRVPRLKENVLRWVQDRLIRRDVFFKETTFVKWWEKLPRGLRDGVEIAAYVSEEGMHLPSCAD
ncbi:protein EDS1B-like [Macadamia integrifolia]|uniref:protein EDS1B-like n=1 Tax=Macadamia integrifolia TaxID=60698 RepID=UPI001C4F2083|nr:protein EDS1B-like [Macadamia integrifolia]